VTRAIEEEAKGVKLSKAQSHAKGMPSQERLNELLSYDPETGTLVWHHTIRRCKAGSDAFTVKSDGKLKTTIDGGKYATPRVVYTLVTGIDPKDATIHCINGDLSDLSWDNLMLETTSNVAMGSSAEDRTRLDYDTKYRARVMVSGKAIRIGDFDTEEEAEAAKSLFIKTLKRKGTPLAP
jgi:outer membrane protein assembly factor BamB